MLRKKIAELAQVTDEEMQSVLKLPRSNKAPTKAMQRQSRSPVSLKKRFTLMALMRPDLVTTQDLDFVQADTPEDQFLAAVLNACLANPGFKPAVLLRSVKGRNDELMSIIEKEMQLLEESVDFALEFAGARAQLLGGMQQLKETQLLNQIKEKPISALTVEERALLKKLGTK
jgi:DNA primase